MARVLVMMSGGVDSSVAAALLGEQGHDVTGVTLKLWGGASESGCCSVADVEDARRVAAQLGIPHYVFNFADDFERDVVDPFARAYAEGLTPNPCIDCNRTIKFGRLLRRAAQLGFDSVATGHHARVERGVEGSLRLVRGADRAKDQSYVLYMLGQAELAATLLPVGTRTKAEVREAAARLGLRTATKAESMDVCFVRRGGRPELVDRRVPSRPGPIVDVEGRVVGRHEGLAAFTVGQRRGLGVALGARRYVIDLDAASATVTIGRRDDLLRERVPLRDLSWVSRPVEAGREVLAQASAHGEPAPARFGGDAVRFAVPRTRVAPGQVVVLYDRADCDVVLGGGIAVSGH